MVCGVDNSAISRAEDYSCPGATSTTNPQRVPRTGSAGRARALLARPTALRAELLRLQAARCLDVVGAVGLRVLAARRLDIVRSVPRSLYDLTARCLDAVEGFACVRGGCHQCRCQRDYECVRALHRHSSSAVLYSPDRALVRPPGSPPADPLVTHRSCQSQPMRMIEKGTRRRFQGETHRVHDETARTLLADGESFVSP